MIFTLADHLEYAIKRAEQKEQLKNPLTEDIRLLFHMEYQVAQCAIPVLKEKASVDIREDEIGFIALHIHSAIENEKISQSMQMAQAVRTCVSKVESLTGVLIDVKSLAYNRLMNHVRYMVIRVSRGEALKVNMNEYMEITFPQSFQIAKEICEEIEKDLKCILCKTEIGYLAMHIERVTNKEEEI
jgi:transcriptional antiterminator